MREENYTRKSFINDKGPGIRLIGSPSEGTDAANMRVEDAAQTSETALNARARGSGEKRLLVENTII